MATRSTLAVVMLMALAPSALGHGWLVEPPARNAPSGPRNGYCPHCGNGNGICGDGGQWPGSSNYLGGENAGPLRTYTAGQAVEFVVRITAHHKGHFELHLCDEHIGPQTQDPQGCLNRWVLERVRPEETYGDCVPNDSRGDCQPLDKDHPERWYLPPSSGTHKMVFRIPAGVQCESCTLQWRWWTANSCIPEGYGCYFAGISAQGWDGAAWCGSWCGGGCPGSLLESNSSRAHQHSESHSGCGGEEFRNCADITVLASGAPGPSPVPSPTPSPVPTPMPPATTTTTRAPAPAGSCVQNTDCVANAWCNDPAYVSWCPMHSAAQCPSPQCMLASAVPSPAPMPSTTPAPATTTKMTVTTTTTMVPVQTTAAPAPAPTPATCASCPGENACIWTDGICYSSVAQDACEATQGALWCGTPAPAPLPPASPCAGCPGEHACIWSDGLCYPRVAREACEGTQGATWCGVGSEPEPEPEPVNMYEQVEGVGAWGGWCTCPDGQRYNVGDKNDGCAAGPGSLACVGGTPGECMQEVDDARKGMQVTCVSEPEPEPEPVNMYEQVEGVGAWGGWCTCPDGQRYNVGDKNDGCAAGPGSLACVGGTPGECMQELDDARKGMQVTCAPGPEPASAMQVAPHGPLAARKKISPHRHGFLATALLQVAAALEHVAGVRDGATEL